MRQIADEYARFFFHPDVAEAGADAILALENNLHGSMAENGTVDGTLRQWQQLERSSPGTSNNWRFDMHLFRAYYDAYTRHRQIYETELEKRALAKLGEAERDRRGCGVRPGMRDFKPGDNAPRQPAMA